MPKKFFIPHTTFDKFFELSILLKMADGLFELVGGILLLIIKPEHVNRLIHAITNNELHEDPHDLVANTLVHWANAFTKSAAIFTAMYLLIHGIVKVILVLEVLRNHLWAYVGLIVVTLGFIVYQIFEVLTHFSVGFLLLTIFDLIVVTLTWQEYVKRRRKLYRE